MVTPVDRRSRRDLLRAGAAALAVGLAGCAGGGGAGDGGDDGGPTSDGGDTTSDGGGTTAGGATDWRTAELTDVLTDEPFTLAGFGGSPVVLEFFAVWCPVCTRQQETIATAREEVDDLVAVSVNVDPNEDADQVRSHAREKGFDWHYAVSPPAVTKALVEEFGTVVTSPPSAPVVRICPEGSSALLEGRGVKSAAEIAAAFDGC